MTPRIPDILALLDSFEPGRDDRAVDSLAATRALLNAPIDPFDRATFDPGHVTASGIVLDPACNHVLLVYHRKLQRWLQPGGHVDADDASVLETARREILEETGVSLRVGSSPLVAVDVHPIPATGREPSHKHHDLMFHFDAADTRLDSGDRPARWVPLAEASALSGDAALARGLRRALTTVGR